MVKTGGFNRNVIDGGWGKKTSIDVICDLIWSVP